MPKLYTYNEYEHPVSWAIFGVPDVPAHVELLLRELVPAQQVVELVHGQAHNLVDGEADARVTGQLLVLVFVYLD